MTPRDCIGLYLLELVLERTESSAMIGGDGSAPDLQGPPDDPLDLLRSTAYSTLSDPETNRDNNLRIIRKNLGQTGSK